MSPKRKGKVLQPFSLNTVLLSRRLVEGWGSTRREKFFMDLGLGRVWRRKAKLARSGPYLISEMFDHMHTTQMGILADVVKETVRVEWYLLKFEQQFAPRQSNLKAITLRELFVERHPQLTDSLRADGYDVYEGEIISLSLEELKENTDNLKSKLRRAGFDTALVHYDQAWDNYVLGNWEAANAQLRSFLQEVFDELALRLYPKEAGQMEPGGNRRQLLESKGFIENEEVSLIKGFIQMAHTRGAHPGRSNQDDCSLRSAIATRLIEHYLDKYLQEPRSSGHATESR